MTGPYTYTGTGYELDDDAARDYIRDGYLLAPRTFFKGQTRLPPSIPQDLSVDINKLPSLVQQELETAMGRMAGARRAVMFSGGFDSMLIGLLARHCGAAVTAVTVQFDDFNRMTVAASAGFARQAGIAHHVLHVKAVEFLSAFEVLAGMTDEPLFDLDLAVVYAAFKKYDHKIAGDVFISGMGSDQWFGNEALEPRPGGLEARLDYQLADEEAHQRVAQAHRCRFVFPFLSKPMLALSQSIPADMKKDKKLLRALAVANMIPPRGTRSEVQVPALMRQVLIKTYGERAWPFPVSVQSKATTKEDQLLRQIILGLWREKVKDRAAGS